QAVEEDVGGAGVAERYQGLDHGPLPRRFLGGVEQLDQGVEGGGVFFAGQLMGRRLAHLLVARVQSLTQSFGGGVVLFVLGGRPTARSRNGSWAASRARRATGTAPRWAVSSLADSMARSSLRVSITSSSTRWPSTAEVAPVSTSRPLTPRSVWPASRASAPRA